MNQLANKKAFLEPKPDAASESREFGTPRFNRLAGELGGGWHVVEEHHLERTYEFKNFREALAFTNKVGELAEEVQHHPDIYLAWGKVKLTLWTHKIDGLTEGDFVFAAKVNKLL